MKRSGKVERKEQGERRTKKCYSRSITGVDTVGSDGAEQKGTKTAAADTSESDGQKMKVGRW